MKKLLLPMLALTAMVGAVFADQNTPGETSSTSPAVASEKAVPAASQASSHKKHHKKTMKKKAGTTTTTAAPVTR